jgi:multidrug efflux pump subunit AcrB
LRNAYIGLGLVAIILGLFLQIRLAFWVTLGIIVAFVGSFLILPSTDVSINMISLFAFLLVLGMVVDDAIVVGESIYRRRQEGMGHLAAAIYGAKEVAAPVIFAIATTVIAYSPMLFVPGPAGKFFIVIPIVVIVVLMLSLVESLLILPAHLAHSKSHDTAKPGLFGWIGRRQQAFSRGLERFIEGRYVPALRWAVKRRYLTLSIGFAIAIATVGLFAGGRLQTEFIPRIESDVVLVRGELPHGAAVEQAEALREFLVEHARASLEELGGRDEHVRGLFAQAGALSFTGAGDPAGGTSSSGSHLVEVAIYFVRSDARPFSSESFANAWRRRTADFPGLNSLSVNYSTGLGSGAAIAIELRHREVELLEAAAAELAERLRGFAGVYDIEDGVSRGKPQLDIRLRAEARTLGLTEADLARQVRGAFFGAEAVRQQRGREEVRTYVRFPAEERTSEHDIERFMVRTPSGGELPLVEAAHVERGRSYTSIRRIDGNRAVRVQADVDRAVGNANEITGTVAREVIPDLIELYPGLQWSLAGEQRDQREINQSLAQSGGLAMLGIFALLAVAFRSYVQPLVIMLVIPFGLVGAIWGHVIMNALGALIPALGTGYAFSLMSTFGVVALAGVVVNDSLILMVAVNRFREQGASLMSAVITGGARRFRPIVLTSVTTFGGLAPMILETSVQARFLVPMVISLGYGVIFATFITLFLVPAAYVVTDDARRAVEWFRSPSTPEAGGG